MKKDKTYKSDGEEWVDILKEKVGSYAGEKPSASWEEMQARMLAAGKGAGKGAGRTLKADGLGSAHNNSRRFWTAAAAACLAAVVAGGIFLGRQQDAPELAESSETAAQQETAVETVSVIPSESEVQVAEAVQDVNMQTASERTSGKASLSAARNEAAENISPASDIADTGTEETVASEEPDSTDKQPAAAGDADVKTSSAPADSGRSTDRYAFAEPQKRQKSGRFSVGVNGQFRNGSEPSGAHFAPTYSNVSTDGEYYAMTFAMAVARTEYHHAAPISFGFAVRYDMPSGLYVESGVRFTQYLTTVTPSGAKQALLYTGIPVGVGYNLYENGNLGVYASGFYMPAKCIAGLESPTYPTNSTSRRDIPIQHSAGISAGADYTVWNRISLYAEPSLSYYFKNELAPVTIFTENPWYFTLNLGARFNF